MVDFDKEELKKRRPINFFAMVITLMFILLAIFLLFEG